MNNINDLKYLLFNDVKINNELKEDIKKVETRIAMFEDLLNLFFISDFNAIKNNLLSINIILDCLYDKNTILALNIDEVIYKCISLNSNNNEYIDKLKKIYLKFKMDYDLEKDKLWQLNSKLMPESDVKQTRKIISSLKYKQEITVEQKEFIKNRLKRENIKFQNIIIILEKINIHNAEILKSQGHKIRYDELYYLINILNQGYEEIELPDINNSLLDEFTDNFIQTFESSSISICNDLLESINYYNKEELEYIYKKILKYYQYQIFDTIESLKDEECYFDTDIIKIIKEEYYNLYNKYMIVRNALNKLDEKVVSDNNISNNIESNPKIKLNYSTNNSEEPMKCWFIKDLEGIREESLNNILTYLNEFKMGISNKIKPLKGHHGYCEIKDDQVRIVLKPIGNDKAIVLGVFIKKDNNDRITYEKIIARSIDLQSDEYCEEVEKYYKNYIEEKARKGTR